MVKGIAANGTRRNAWPHRWPLAEIINTWIFTITSGVVELVMIRAVIPDQNEKSSLLFKGIHEQIVMISNLGHLILHIILLYISASMQSLHVRCNRWRTHFGI